MTDEVYGYIPEELYPGQSKEIVITVPDNYSSDTHTISLLIESAYTRCVIMSGIKVDSDTYIVSPDLSSKLLGEYYFVFTIVENENKFTSIDKVYVKVKR